MIAHGREINVHTLWVTTAVYSFEQSVRWKIFVSGRQVVVLAVLRFDFIIEKRLWLGGHASDGCGDPS